MSTKHDEVTIEINQWAKEKTNGLITDVIPEDAIDSSTRLVFANALYFKGQWSCKFDATLTKDDEFHLLNGTSIHVPFMSSYKEQYLRSFDDFLVLGLPYTQGAEKRSFTMYFFLPKVKDGLPALLSRITESGFVDRHLPNRKVEVGKLRIPKFKISFQFEATEVFKEFGLGSLFTDDCLTEMADPENLYVKSIIHKSFIEVNEEGTEAAAVTVTVASIQCLRTYEKLNFIADHPFFFIIRENTTGALLFTGQVHDPSTG